MRHGVVRQSHGALTGGEHGGGAARHGVLPLLGEIRDFPDEDAVVCGRGHVPHLPLHLHDGQVPQAHRPLQLADLQEHTEDNNSATSL